ncbi:hypothetical protein D9758_016964 [Tetrapyrgos nigripes]|uniref:Uncharacterized protein n=1 Tax=Tetrapyrgos nigripes TaxID=182062 RepID=A0A8H5CB99_9AGAR|nr:hypothetical protein D9758_016964 [Tetrapyrgos nigripes]
MCFNSAITVMSNWVFNIVQIQALVNPAYDPTEAMIRAQSLGWSIFDAFVAIRALLIEDDSYSPTQVIFPASLIFTNLTAILLIVYKTWQYKQLGLLADRMIRRLSADEASDSDGGWASGDAPIRPSVDDRRMAEKGLFDTLNILIPLLEVASMWEKYWPSGQSHSCHNKNVSIYISHPSADDRVIRRMPSADADWHEPYRQSIKVHLRNLSRKGQVEQLLVLLIESGVLYCIPWIVTLPAGFVSEKYTDSVGIFMDVITPHIEVIYPTAIILLSLVYRAQQDSLLSAISLSAPLGFAAPAPSSQSISLTPVHGTLDGDKESQEVGGGSSAMV